MIVGFSSMSVDEDESRVSKNGRRPNENEDYTNDACSDTTSNNEGVGEDEEDEEEKENGRVATISSKALQPATTNIHMENTSEVQVGPRLLYNAPVTVNQHVHVGTGNGDVLQYALKAPLQDLEVNTNNLKGDYSLKTQAGKDKPSRHTHRWKWILTIVIVVALLVVALVIAIYFVTNSSETVDKSTTYPEVPPVKPINPNAALPGGGRIFAKDDWYGQPPKYVRKLQHPTPFVVISHTVSEPCYEYKVCAQEMRKLQKMHINRDFPDLGYNFVVGNDGNVYEAGGWDTINMHTGYVRFCNIGISLIGNFVQDVPTVHQLSATQELIVLGIKLGKIDPNYKLVPMNATFNTLSPGRNLYKIMKEWPHFWVPTDKDIGMCPLDV